MNLYDLFEIEFVDTIKNDTKQIIISQLKNIKIDNLLNLDKELINQYIIIISQNFVFNKLIDPSNTNIFNQLIDHIQDYIYINNNDFIEDAYIEDGAIEDDDIEDDYIEDGAIEDDDIEDAYIEDGAIEDAYIEDGAIEDAYIEDAYIEDGDSTKKTNIKIKIKKTEYIQMHLFHKKYDFYNKKWDKKYVKYITTIFIDGSEKINKYFNVNNSHYGQFENFKNVNTIDKINKLKNLSVYSKLVSVEYYNNLYKNYNDLDIISDYINIYNELDLNYLNILSKIHSGLYINNFDVRLQILLRQYITTNYGNNGAIIPYKKHHQFNYGNTLIHYFPHINLEKCSSFEIILIQNINIICDSCGKPLSENIEHCYYHNNDAGDICIECYNTKKNKDIMYIKYLKKMMLLQGKRNIFKMELEKTIIFLKKYKIKKLKKLKYYKLLENINKTLITKSINKRCKICYEILDINKDIYVGSNCGHCFHKTCIDLSHSLGDICQICRTPTKFIKLYI